MNYRKSLLVGLIFVALSVPAVAANAQQSCRSFPETGHQVCGRLLEYWEQSGGLPVFGYPIAGQSAQRVEGRSVQAQLFERNRLELHPENARPYDVLLGRQGADALAQQGRDWATLPKAGPSAAHYFAETGHAIASQFWGYWSSHGLEFDGQAAASFQESLALFGLPLSEAAPEISPTDGKTYLTQWFERARFEFHPEHAGTPYEVLLGLLGAELAGGATPPAPAQAAGFATQVIELANAERTRAGCPPLATNDTLMRVAQAHSQDMADHDFFSHTGSDGRSPFQRLRDAGYDYRLAAENIAVGVATPAAALGLWMDSPGHRANILNCELRETGVGFVEDPGDALNYGAYWTQVFGMR
ncbi:MAG: CAP domain-containing protein [Roseiflexaceae bacterium]